MISMKFNLNGIFYLIYKVYLIIYLNFNFKIKCDVVELSDKNFNVVLMFRPLTLIMFYADWYFRDKI